MTMRAIWVSMAAMFLSVFSMIGQAAEQVSVYTFAEDQSVVHQTGGFAGVDWAYALEGQFQLLIDPNAGTAVFTAVDANAVRVDDPSQSFDLNKVFHLTSVASAIADETLALFVGYADDGSSIAVTLVFREDGSVRLVGQTLPPMNSADFFVFALDAVGERYGGGTGEPNDPYRITTAADLIALGESPEDYDKYFILTADIDLANHIFDRAVIAPVELTYSRSGCGIIGAAFSGVFNGQGHAIRNFRIESGGDDEAMGLFGGVAVGGRIINLGVENASIKGLYAVGGVVGFNRGSVSQCRCAGEVHGTAEVGGLVGYNDQGSITLSHSIVTVSGTYYIGGLAGYNSGTITFSYSDGAVSGNTVVGGLVGSNSGPITSAYSTGAVSGEDTDIGGFAGHSVSSMIMSSFWDIETSEQPSSDGGIGKATAEMRMASTFLNAGWDFVGETDNGSEDIWWIDEGLDYPRLWWELEDE